MRIACIDFETANAKRASACAIGLSIIEDGRITQTSERLILPHLSCRRFSSMNIHIHGIHPEDVQNALEWVELAPWVHGIFEKVDFLVAHNASFDISVLRALNRLYAIPDPDCRFLCTLRIAKRHWPHLPSHRLNSLCEYTRIPLSHHQAGSDARAAGALLLHIQREMGIESPQALLASLGLCPGTLSATDYSPCSSA